MVRFSVAAVAFALVTATWAGGAVAQNSSAQEAERAERVTYESQLGDLGRVLGGSHYLRILCAGRGDQRWRDYMRGVISREPSQTGLLTAAFNEGYRTEESRFPVCDRGAQQTESELRAQGLRLANGLAVRNAGDAPRRTDR